MSNAMKSMQVEQIANTMQEFEKSFEDMDVRSGYMESAMDSTTCMSTPPEEVDKLISMVADEAGLQLSEQLEHAGSKTINANTNSTANSNNSSAVAKDPTADFESRLAALRG